MKLNNITKYFLVVILLAVTLPALAADSSSTTNTNNSTNPQTTTDQTNNTILLQNAANSQKNKKDTSNDWKKVLNGGSAAPSKDNLTDAEKELSENYVHEGKANRLIMEACSGDTNQQICSGSNPNTSKTALINGVAKAYAVFGSMIDDKMLALKRNVDPKTIDKEKTDSASKKTSTDKDKDKENEETQPDYCKYIPTASETIATVWASTTALNLGNSSSGDTKQKASLLKAAKSHEDRATGAKIQSYGWFGGAACYVAMYAYSQTNPATAIKANSALIIKTAAATFLGKMYNDEVNENEGYAEKIKKLAASLPGKGDCNPITENACYCSQPETQNDPNNCASTIAAKKAAADNIVKVSCVDNNLKADTSCYCKKTNSCFETLVASNTGISNSLSFGTSSSNPFTPIRKLTNGELTIGNVGTANIGNLAAIAKKGLQDITEKVGANNNLSNADAKLLATYTAAGISANAASHLAGLNLNKSALDDGLNKATKLSLTNNNGSLPTVSSNSNKLVDFSNSGKGTNSIKNNKNQDVDFMSKLGVKKDDNNRNNKVIEFAAQKAVQQNQISKSERSIFEIISNRYAGSALNRLNLEDKN